MTLDVPLSVKIEEWRRQATEGTLSIEDMREAVEAIRNGRTSAAARSATSRAKKAPVDVSALENELDGL